MQHLLYAACSFLSQLSSLLYPPPLGSQACEHLSRTCAFADAASAIHGCRACGPAYHALITAACAVALKRRLRLGRTLKWRTLCDVAQA
ncbi:hypothetical protein NL676_003022 [Syzygium grande]|nr:hypothetical protein NL676_003022 [Syzygium grande]